MSGRLAAVLLGLAVARGAHADDARLPKKVAAAVAVRAPDAVVERAERTGPRYDLVLAVHGTFVRAGYTRRGVFLEAITPTDPTAVPAAMLSAAEAYGQVLDVFRVDLPEPQPAIYEALVDDRRDRVRLRVTAEGQVLSHEVLPRAAVRDPDAPPPRPGDDDADDGTSR
ncbi:MAG: hypothetical protein H6733_14860 [Alphaproteobacteria bacterium]|nr:hypothetical protein [Alphaproteobacteria bacterium]